MRTVEWHKAKLRLIDQRALPTELRFVELEDSAAVAAAIGNMVVRGAPAIGAAAAFGLALAARRSGAESRADLLEDLEDAAAILAASRPTAVNLAWALARVMERVAAEGDLGQMRQVALEAAQAIADEDVSVNRRLGQVGAALVPEGATVLHHCNTGALATVDYGTALGVIRAAHEQGKGIHVLVDETRPRLQGARLTTWELQQLSIPFTLIADNAAGHFLRTGQVDIVLVGADRVAANGDVVNKIGTYMLAVVAKENGIPFCACVPTSTVDLATPTGDDIEIEERPADEITGLTFLGKPVAPRGIQVANPAFDVTPHRYITGIVTENGVARPPFHNSLPALVGPSEEVQTNVG
ncbi:MAG: S-methyl-5-thioribose-1-phosphate isomerase [Anaerolineales bacterium]|nr:MAG: S-methyl-5-thioribose-1-phosphate isomerase [Anaerolineales bacterium]